MELAHEFLVGWFVFMVAALWTVKYREHWSWWLPVSLTVISVSCWGTAIWLSS
jgi:hypothetical protein